MKRICIAMTAIGLAGTLMAGWGWAGSLNPTNAPGSTMHTLEDIHRLLTSASAETKIGINNTNVPAATMHTVEEIYQLVNSVMSSGASLPVDVLESGQTVSYAAGDDGALRSGVAWPTPVFTVGSGLEANCVTDNRTGLMWMRNSSSTPRSWTDALTYCANLNDPVNTNLLLGSYTDWRMPNTREMLTLFDYSSPSGNNGLLPAGHPFVGAGVSNYVWTSTTLPWDVNRVWNVFMRESFLSIPLKTDATGQYVMPVRGGK